MLDIQTVKNSANYRVQIHGEGLDVRGWLSEDFSLTTSSHYASPFEEQRGQSSLSDVVNKVITAINTVTQRELAQVHLKSFFQTVALWQGSERPSFSVTLYFVAETQDDNVLKPLSQLQRATVPGEASKLMKAPLGYAPTLSPNVKASSVKGTVALRIGQWFEAYGLLITSVSATVSGTVMPNGLPLWSRATVQFMPYRMPDYKMLRSWFKF